MLGRDTADLPVTFVEPENASSLCGKSLDWVEAVRPLAVRICLVYDCLYPFTVGGAERWYANLAERLAAEGHAVTYLTLRQWDSDSPPVIDGVEVIAVGPRLSLYNGGRRRIVPPLVFGAGVLWHLLQTRRRYDVVHTASFPYFSVLAAAAARIVRRYRLVVDWHEVWSERVLARVPRAGRRPRSGSAVQRLCLRVPQQAFCFSRLTRHGSATLGVNGTVTRLEGEYDGPLTVGEPLPARAGRRVRRPAHPEKRVLAIPPAIAGPEANSRLRCEIYGDGPDRAACCELWPSSDSRRWSTPPDSSTPSGSSRAFRRALPAAAVTSRGLRAGRPRGGGRGTPSIVVRGPDNAATELVEENGFVAPSASARIWRMSSPRWPTAGLR